MADLSITAADVQQVDTQTRQRDDVAGEAITAGQPYYIDSSDGLAYVADKTSASKDDPVGIALNSCGASQPVRGSTPGATIDLGVALTNGETYVLSATGGISPIGDLASTNYVAYIGFKNTAGYLDTTILKGTGVQVP